MRLVLKRALNVLLLHVGYHSSKQHGFISSRLLKEVAMAPCCHLLTVGCAQEKFLGKGRRNLRDNPAMDFQRFSTDDKWCTHGRPSGF